MELSKQNEEKKEEEWGGGGVGRVWNHLCQMPKDYSTMISNVLFHSVFWTFTSWTPLNNVKLLVAFVVGTVLLHL